MGAAAGPQRFPEIRWQFAPLDLNLGEGASLPLPSGMIAAQGEEMRRFLLATGNQLTGRELAVLGPDDLGWFAVISTEPGRAQHRAEWVENSVEADGRKVVIRTVALPVRERAVVFEVVSEQAEEPRARAEFDALMARWASRQAPAPDARQWAPMLAVTVLAGTLLWLIRRRQRGL